MKTTIHDPIRRLTTVRLADGEMFEIHDVDVRMSGLSVWQYAERLHFARRRAMERMKQHNRRTWGARKPNRRRR